MTARPWSSLARFNGTADRCTCSNAQLNNVGCDCRAEQNLPVRCEDDDCGEFLRSEAEIGRGLCNRCHTHGTLSDRAEREHERQALGGSYPY